jgi:asparagine synthase (glutamine-hydrolysing)
MPQTLEILDRAAGAHSVEVRFPFWDKRLIEFCVSLPARQKLRHGWSRFAMRQAMNGILPPEIRWRGGKSDMRPSFNHGLLTYEREHIDDVVLRRPSAVAEYVDIAALRTYYERFRKAEAFESEILAIQRCVSLGLWLQRMN